MKQLITSTLSLDLKHIEADSPMFGSLHRWIALLFVSLALTFDSFVLGFSLVLLTSVGAVDGRSGWSMLGNGLIAAVFPLLLLTAHCMDRVDAEGNAIRLEYCRENALFFDDPV